MGIDINLGLVKPPQYDECYAELRRHLPTAALVNIMAVRPEVLRRVLEYHDALEAKVRELEVQAGAARAEGWIDCRDEMPTAFGKDYLVSVLLMQSTRRRTQVSTLWESGWGNVFREEYVTHWQPKPADPLALLSDPKGASK